MKPRPCFSGSPKRVKTLILIRHGESQWNYLFNNINGISLWRIAEMMFSEFLVIMKQDSYFLDAPLSQKGVKQAVALRDFLADGASKSRYWDLLTGTNKSTEIKTRIFSSNLRRAVSTVIISLKDRMERTGEFVHTLSELQEITRNVDSFSITPLGQPPKSSQLEQTLRKTMSINMPDLLSQRVEASGNTGHKRIFGNGASRVNQFVARLFQSKEDCFIVGGHSLFFKEIFKGYLPAESTSDSKKFKIKNGGVIGFEIGEFVDPETGNVAYQILENSIDNIYLGFDKIGKGNRLFAQDTILASFGVLMLAWRSILGFFSKKRFFIKTEKKDK